MPTIKRGLALGASKALKGAARAIEGGIKGEKLLKERFEVYMREAGRKINPQGQAPAPSVEFSPDDVEAVNPFAKWRREVEKEKAKGQAKEDSSSYSAAESSTTTRTSSSTYWPPTPSLLTRIRSRIPTINIPFLSSRSSSTTTTSKRNPLRVIIILSLTAIFLYGLGSAIPHAVTKYLLGRSKAAVDERLWDLEEEKRRRRVGGWIRVSGEGAGFSGEVEREGKQSGGEGSVERKNLEMGRDVEASVVGAGAE